MDNNLTIDAMKFWVISIFTALLYTTCHVITFVESKLKMKELNQGENTKDMSFML